ncbi:MAG: mechanosensitive ion channel family protein [Endomicrobium sp.]|jgi:small-conductance mechanosensitive channel|nr:mechanosensitive ion channel family protein [Endomicrobium sp.]
MVSIFLDVNLISWIEAVILLVSTSFLGFIFRNYIAITVKKLSNKFKFLSNESLEIYIYFWYFLIISYITILKLPINIPQNIIHKIFYTIFVFSLLVLISSILSDLFCKLISNKIKPKVIKLSIVFIEFIFFLDQIGIKVKPILFGMCLTSAPMVLAFQDIFAGFYSGVVIFISKNISKGDYIKLDTGEEGTVLAINWRTTTIRGMSNIVIIIPNTKLSSAIITNFNNNNNSEITGYVSCKVSYDNNLEHVENIAILAAKEIINKYECTVKSYIPIVLFTSFGDYAINFNLLFKVKHIYFKALIQSEILKSVYKKFKDENIKIPIISNNFILNK